MTLKHLFGRRGVDYSFVFHCVILVCSVCFYFVFNIIFVTVVFKVPSREDCSWLCTFFIVLFLEVHSVFSVSIYLSIYLSISIYIYLPICRSIYLSVYLSIYIFIYPCMDELSRKAYSLAISY